MLSHGHLQHKIDNILYDWQLSLVSFCFGETYLLHFTLFVVNNSAISTPAEGTGEKGKKEKKKMIPGTQPKARA